MLAEDAVGLIKEAKRTPDVITVYNEECVRAVVSEVKLLYDDIQKAFTTREIRERNDPRYASAIVVNHSSLRLNKRCLLAYMMHRVELIKKMCWDLGPTAPGGLKDALSRSENTFCRNYNNLVSRFKAHYVDLDLTATLLPPKELFIEVRVLKDCGVIETETGSISLHLHSQHFVKRSDVEHLVKQGYLVHVS